LPEAETILRYELVSFMNEDGIDNQFH
jgi:hypothetical protein